MPQDKAAHVRTLLKEVEVYRAHCLFVEAKKRADELIQCIRQTDRVSAKEQILRSLGTKVREIEEEAEAFEAIGLSTKLSARDKGRIRQVFSSAFEPGTDAAVYEAATAFLVFGQFQEALAEFRKLIKSDAFRVAAVKNIFRCYIGLSALKHAVALYLKLQGAETFPPEELERVRYFLHSILKMKGVGRKLPKPKATKPAPKREDRPPSKAPPSKKEDIVVEPSLDILSVTLPYLDRQQAKKTVALDVNFQRKNTLSVIVPKTCTDLIDYLRPGMKLENLQMNSTDVIFIDDGVVHGKSEIRVGEKRGDYTLTVKLDSG